VCVDVDVGGTGVVDKLATGGYGIDVDVDTESEVDGDIELN